MKLIFTITCLFSILHLNAQKTKIELKYFNISFYPNKCIDTFRTKIPSGQLKGDSISIFLNSCMGECKFIVTNRNDKIILSGNYSNSIDTLKSYKFTKFMGKPKDEYHYRVILMKHFEPLKSGIWIFYNSDRKIVKSINYIPVLR